MSEQTAVGQTIKIFEHMLKMAVKLLTNSIENRVKLSPFTLKQLVSMILHLDLGKFVQHKATVTSKMNILTPILDLAKAYLEYSFEYGEEVSCTTQIRILSMIQLRDLMAKEAKGAKHNEWASNVYNTTLLTRETQFVPRNAQWQATG